MLPYGVGGALAIRVGATLPHSVKRAKQLAWGCLLVSTVLSGLVSMALYWYRHVIYRIFTKEQDVIDGCEEIWWMVSLYYFILTVFAINMGISTGLGTQWTDGIITVVFIWTIGFPGAYYFAILQHGGLVIAWYWIWPPYAGIDVFLLAFLVWKDWHEVSALIRLREAVDPVSGECDSLLLNIDDLDQPGLFYASCVSPVNDSPTVRHRNPENLSFEGST
jgi:Na+-driven multidrug efflux pump